MSAREFDNYLVLLGKFLGLSGPQRDAIAGELSDHFEERLAELESQGVAHDRAVRIAVEEFGDAAGLASRFLSLSRNNRRRWIMRCTAFSLAGALTALVLVTAFWPQENTGPGPRRLAAQNPPGGLLGGGGGGAQPPGLAPTIDENNAATEGKLAERMTAEFVETPLSDVLQFAADYNKFEVYIDRKALEEEGVTIDIPVSLNLKKVRGDMFLDLVLKQAGGLTYVVRDGIVVISTASALQQATEVRVYNCRDLMALPQFNGAGQPGGYPGGLLQPQPPGAGGLGSPLPSGPGSSGITPPGGAAPGTLPPSGAPPAPGTTQPPAGSSDAPRSGLESSGPGDEFDPRATLRQLFDNQVGGGAGIAGAGGLGGGAMGGGFAPGGMGMMGLMEQPQSPAAKLISIIEASVFPDTWANNGGAGTIGEYGGLLVVNNNVRVHREVEKLLDMLREAAVKQPGATVRGR